jgi:hypothetical protein
MKRKVLSVDICFMAVKGKLFALILKKCRGNKTRFYVLYAAHALQATQPSDMQTNSQCYNMIVVIAY